MPATAQELATEASLQVSWVLGKCKKPFSDAEIVWMYEWSTECYVGGDSKGWNNTENSGSTATRRTEVLANDLLDQLNSAVKRVEFISLAVDESTCITENAQLMVFVRLSDIETGKFIEGISGLTAQEGMTFTKQ